MQRSTVVAAAALITLWALSCKGPEGPAGPAGTGLESLGDPSIQPRVIYTYPPANTVGPYEDLYLLLGWFIDREPGYFVPIYISQFQLRFNKYMDPASVRRSIAFSSSLGDVRADTNHTVSIGGDVFLINPVDTIGQRFSRWRVGRSYSFTVSSEARDINGNTLQPGFSMNFTPEPYFRVKHVFPRNGAADITPHGFNYPEIVLVFNSRVDTSIASSIQLSPAVAGEWYVSYDSASTYFVVAQDLKNSTMYTITVNTAAHDKFGNHLPQPFISSFTTLPFEVRTTYPPNQSTDIGLHLSIEVEFTAVLDTSTIRSALRIQPGAPGALNLIPGSSYFQFVPSGELMFDTTYSVTIDTTLRSKRGLRLAEPYVFSFRTQPFSVSSTFPSDDQQNVNRGIYPVVYFNATIDTSTVRTSFNLADSAGASVPGTFALNSGPVSFFQFYPAGLLAPNVTYRATISPGLRSAAGPALKTPYSFSFTTGD